jgi:hypothetical protein
MYITFIIRIFAWFSPVSFACFSSGLFLSHRSFLREERSVAQISSWPRGRDLGISSSAVRSHECWRAGDGPARLNAGGPLDVLRLGSALPPPLFLFLVCV